MKTGYHPSSSDKARHRAMTRILSKESSRFDNVTTTSSCCPVLQSVGEMAQASSLGAVGCDNFAYMFAKSTAFFVLGAATLGSEAFISPIASILMRQNLWLRIYLGFGLYIPGILLTLYLPETLNLEGLSDQQQSNMIGETTAEEGRQYRISVWSHVQQSIRKLQTATMFFIRGNWHVVLLLLTLLTTTLGKMAQEMLLQFIRKRFGWSWSKTGYLVSLKAILALTLFACILPAVNYALTKVLSMQPQRKDLFVARISCVLLVVGNLAIGFPTTEAFMLLAMLENVGAIVAGPLLAACFRADLHLNGIWTSLPFMLAAVLCVLSLGILYSVRIS
ncbi:Efflux pump ustT-like protein [Cladobotryum mycophilum]|uniref:Efflux pump ustT-like protein n=1 Tax=Cladobotryum mycophilum TaxID=491253 RepID=A0ABR0SLM4_9HYPO